jgi:cytochrome b6-f complex iron-sulfur subunit
MVEQTTPEKDHDAQTLSAYPPFPVQKLDRREFVNWGLVAWGTFATAAGLGGLPLARFLFPNVLFEPVQSFKAGFPEEYTVGEVDSRWLPQYRVWVVRESDHFYALLGVCTHLGCTPAWLKGEAKFKCPCHGSGFRKTGIHFEGPAPRPLERTRIALAEDGQLLVDKSKTFQWEKGQWEDPDSFLVYSG